MTHFRIAGFWDHLNARLYVKLHFSHYLTFALVTGIVMHWSKRWDAVGANAEGGDLKICEHVKEAKDLQPAEQVCEECIQMGDSWVHLRICLTCGHVGCCDSSKNKHATKHFHRVQHPMVRSIEPGESWGWCYVDEITYDLSRGVKHAVVLG